MYPLIDWPVDIPISIDESYQNLLIPNIDNLPHYTELSEFIEGSDGFPVKFPIDTSRCKTLKTQVSTEVLLRNINSAYPVLHEGMLPLFAKFILHKRMYGSAVETSLYKNMSLLDLVDRLLKKRAVEFVSQYDYYILLNGAKGHGGWEDIGKDHEKSPLLIEDCLSYDEIKLSAFLSVSSYTYFINVGHRKNRGVVPEDRGNLQEEGIIIGLIGPRMVKPHCMDYQDIVIDKLQNDKARGYGTGSFPTMPKLFSSFYDKPCWTYKDLSKSKERKKSDHYTEIVKGVYFDNVTYAKRLAFSIDTLLFEANHRAKERSTSAYVHVVGIGLGVWMISKHQEDVFMQTFARRVKYMGHYLHNISDLHFAYFFFAKTCGEYKDGSIIPISGHPNKGIRIFISERQPHEALVGDNEGKLLVVSYAWDGNALPGNEYWNGSLGSSSDPAAACSTQVAEVHNPHINRNVSASNLRIASNGNVYPYEEYVRKIFGENKASSSK